MTPVVEARGIAKLYGSLVAVDDLTVAVEAGEVLGILGPNGAGKTTAVRILTTLLRPEEGRASVLGYDVRADAPRVGSLLGTKTVLNELLAYLDMKNQFAANPNYVSPRSALLATYALCGFANFASIGIQVGGIGQMAPGRRHELSRLGLLAMVGGGLASLMAAAVIGVLV